MNTDSGQPWSPPQELMLPIPRPIKGMEVAAARYIRIVGGVLISFGGMALFGWALFGLSWAPGTTIGAKWEQFPAGPSFARISMSLIVYGSFFLAWLICLFWFRKSEWLLKLGKPARAVVIDVRRSRVPSRCDPDFTITFEFHDSIGKLVKGKMPDRPKNRG